MIGDTYGVDEVDRYVAAAREIKGSYPESNLVPKCRGAIHAIPDDLVVGYSRGYADRLAHKFSELSDWRGRRVHILGGSPPKQLDVIKQLTRPTLTGDPPADIIGLDWNGLHRGAQFGEFWTASEWDDSGRDAEHMTIGKTVRCSLAKVREFWQARGVWPESTTKEDGVEFEYRGPSPSDIESAACAECGVNVWTTERGPYVAEYDTGDNCGYCSNDCYFTHRHRNQLEKASRRTKRLLPDSLSSESFFVPEGVRARKRAYKRVILHESKQHPRDISIDQIPIHLPNTQTSGGDPADVPEERRCHFSEVEVESD